MSTPGGVDISRLVAKVTGQPGQSECWAKFLTGDPRLFLDALEEAEDERRGSVTRKDAATAFGEEFGVELNSPRLGYHLRRDCLCRP